MTGDGVKVLIKPNNHFNRRRGLAVPRRCSASLCCTAHSLLATVLLLVQWKAEDWEDEVEAGELRYYEIAHLKITKQMLISVTRNSLTFRSSVGEECPD